MYDLILVTIENANLYAQSSNENVTPSCSTSPSAYYKEVTPSPYSWLIKQA